MRVRYSSIAETAGVSLKTSASSASALTALRPRCLPPFFSPHTRTGTSLSWYCWRAALARTAPRSSFRGNLVVLEWCRGGTAGLPRASSAGGKRGLPRAPSFPLVCSSHVHRPLAETFVPLLRPGTRESSPSSMGPGASRRVGGAALLVLLLIGAACGQQQTKCR